MAGAEGSTLDLKIPLAPQKMEAEELNQNS